MFVADWSLPATEIHTDWSFTPIIDFQSQSYGQSFGSVLQVIMENEHFRHGWHLSRGRYRWAQSRPGTSHYPRGPITIK